MEKHSVYYHKCLDQLEELIQELHGLGVFEMKSADEVYHKLRHVTLLDDIRFVDMGGDNSTIMWDIDYKSLTLTLYWSIEKGLELGTAIDFWIDEDGVEPYVFEGHWFDEQQEI